MNMDTLIAGGLVRVLDYVRSDLAARFYVDAAQFTNPTVSGGNPAASFQGTIPLRDGSSFIMLGLELDQFDASQVRVWLHTDALGKRMQKEWYLTSDWSRRSFNDLGTEIANVLGKHWIEPFLMAL